MIDKMENIEIQRMTTREVEENLRKEQETYLELLNGDGGVVDYETIHKLHLKLLALREEYEKIKQRRRELLLCLTNVKRGE
jgi:hypothetical protein